MDIKQVQKLAESWAMSPAIKQRIMENKMTIRDIEFVEKSIMSAILERIRIELETLIESMQEGGMKVNEMKQQGVEEIDINWVAEAYDSLLECLSGLKEVTEDFGLTEVQTEAEQNDKQDM